MIAVVLAVAGVALCAVSLAARKRHRLSAWSTPFEVGACVLLGISGAFDGNLWLAALFGVFAAGSVALELELRRARRSQAAALAVLAKLAEGSPE